jgi:hypothetical protein
MTTEYIIDRGGGGGVRQFVVTLLINPFCCLAQSMTRSLTVAVFISPQSQIVSEQTVMKSDQAHSNYEGLMGSFLLLRPLAVYLRPDLNHVDTLI